MKRLISSMLCVALFIALLPITTFATEIIASGECGDNLTWTLDSEGTLTISGTGVMWDNYNFATNIGNSETDFSIKSIVLEQGVTDISNNAFKKCYSLESINISNTVTNIGEYAFNDCYSLKSIAIPDSVLSIGDCAFSNCIWLSSINLGSGVSYIGLQAFEGCEELVNIAIPSGVTKITSGLFSYCYKLQNVFIPNTVTDIEDQAFVECESLTSITIPNSVDVLGWNILGDYSIPNIYYGGTEGKWKSIAYWEDGTPKLNAADVHFENPASDGLEYTLLEDGTYEISGIGNVTNSHIGIPTSHNGKSVVKIADAAFENCTQLISITFIGGTSEIGNHAFNGCSNLENVIFAEGTTRIDDYAFAGCNNLTNISIPGSVINIGEGAFAGCSEIESVVLCEGIKNIYNGAFARCTKLKNICIPLSVKYIGYDAFSLCETLESATILNSNITIDVPDENSYNYALFYGCYSLNDIYFGGTETKWINSGGNEAVIKSNISPTIHYALTSNNSISGILRSGSDWSINWECTYDEDDEGNITNGEVTIQMTGSGDENDLYIFNGNGGNFSWEEAPYNIPKTAIEKLTIKGHSNVSLRVATNSFKGYNSLKTFIGSYLSGVDANAFEGCSSLEKVGIAYPKDNFSYGTNAFKDCTKLNDVTFSQKLWHIGDGAFQNTKLGTITLYDNINDIGDDAFVGCSNIKIRCYENSIAHQYAVDNNITFELIDAYETYTIYGEHGEEYIFDLTLEDFISQTTTTTYNPNLAYMLMTLCYSAYEQDNMKKSLDELGFSDTYFSYQNSLSYSLGKKTLPNGKKLVLVTVKGTQNNEEWQRNLTIDPVNTFGAAWHTGFSTGSLQIYTDLIKFCNENFDNTTFVITGHSLGAGVANLLEVRLSDNGIAKENVYGYNFACPDVATAPSIGLDWNRFGTHDNMFNIGHAGDLVSIVPGVVGDTFLTAGKIIFTWGKFGRNYWFAYDWRDSDELNVFNFDHHLPTNYVNFLKNNKYGLNKYKNWDEKNGAVSNAVGIDIGTAIYNIFYAACPVDVIIKNHSDEIIASVIDDKVNYYNSDFGEVIITTYGDKKSIAVKSGQDLTVDFIATGEGTMTYSAVTTNILTDEILFEKTFENVALTTGKEMKSEINATDNGSAPDMSDVSLYVVDDRGDIVKEVLPDGTGTEVELKTITFDANGGSISTTTTKTNAEGKLTSLPTPTRSSYEFDGWYTSSTGGDKITTTTIFTQDATVYAHWTKSSSGGSTGGGGGGTTSYTIKFETNGGSKIDSVKSTGIAISEPTEPTKDGHTFNGWYTDKELTSKYDFSNKITKSFILYAAWVENTEQKQPTTETKNPFADVNTDDWFYNAVMFAYENNITSGISETEFAPQGKVTRGQFITMLCRAYGISEMTGDNFDDCGDTWYTGYLAAAKQLGISNGVGDNKFAPEKEITREEMVTLIYNYLKSVDKADETANATSFADDNTISEWAKSAVSFASSKGYVNGKDNNIFDAQGTATRAELAQIFYNILAK